MAHVLAGAVPAPPGTTGDFMWLHSELLGPLQISAPAHRSGSTGSQSYVLGLDAAEQTELMSGDGGE